MKVSDKDDILIRNIPQINYSAFLIPGALNRVYESFQPVNIFHTKILFLIISYPRHFTFRIGNYLRGHLRLRTRPGKTPPSILLKRSKTLLVRKVNIKRWNTISLIKMIKNHIANSFKTSFLLNLSDGE